MIRSVPIPHFFPHFCGMPCSSAGKTGDPAVFPERMAGFANQSGRKRAISPFLLPKWRVRRHRAVPPCIPDEGIQRIADTLIGWQEEEKLSRIVGHAELKKNDYNISPSRYIHTSDAETYRPIAEIVEELNVIEGEARETDKALREILKKIGV